MYVNFTFNNLEEFNELLDKTTKEIEELTNDLYNLQHFRLEIVGNAVDTMDEHKKADHRK